MNNDLQSILARFDPPTVNNSREIVRKKVEKFMVSPSDRAAMELEKLGINVDWNNGDNGY